MQAIWHWADAPELLWIGMVFNLDNNLMRCFKTQRKDGQCAASLPRPRIQSLFYSMG